MTKGASLIVSAGALTSVVVLTVTACNAANRPVPSKDTGTGQAASPALPARFEQQTINWTPCGPEVTQEALPGAECGWISVPVDYAAPDKDSIKLRLSRIRATDQKHRLGSLLNNPGGPGAGGAADVAAGTWQPGEKVKARYDLIGFDPRGIGDSAPIHCPADKDAPDRSSGRLPRTQAEADKAFAAAAARAKACQKASGPVFAHMDSVSVARDMDVIRTVLGDRKLTYVGTSYGTFIGQKYAELFPSKVGRLVLDGVVDPGQDMKQVTELDVKVTQEAFERYARDCAAQRACPLGTTATQALGTATQLVQGLDSTPLRDADGQDIDSDAAADAITKVVFDKDQWPQLTKALAAAQAGDGKLLALLGQDDKQAQDAKRRGSARTPLPRADADANSDIAQPAVLCLDSKVPRSAKEILDTADELTKKSPLFGRTQAWSMLDCAAWPLAPTTKAEPVTAPGAPPPLLVSYSLDQATPLENARAVQKNLGSASLITRQGAGHGAYMSGSACTDRHVDTYLIDGTVPPRNTICPN